MRLSARDGGDPLDEVVERGCRMAFLVQHRRDDLRGVRLGKATLAEERLAIVILAGDDTFPCRADALHEGQRGGVRESLERRCCLMGKSIGREFGMADGDFLEILDAVG